MRASPKYFLCGIIFVALMLLTLFQGSTHSIATNLQSTPTVLPPEEMQQITPENADQIVQIARIGDGYLSGSVAWSPNGNIIAAASTIGIKLYDTDLELIGLLEGYSSLIREVAWSSNGDYLASASDDGVVRIWDMGNQTIYLALSGHTDAVRSITWSPDGTRLASGSIDGTVRVWDINTGQQVLVIETDIRFFQVFSVDWSPDGSYLAFGGTDNAVRIVNASSGEIVNILENNGYVIGIAWSPDGQFMATGNRNQLVRIWDIQAERVIEEVEFDLSVGNITWSPDGMFLVVAEFGRSVLLWDVIENEWTTLTSNNAGLLWSLAWSPDGKKLVVADSGLFENSDIQRNIVRLWNMTTQQEEIIVEDVVYPDSPLAWSPNRPNQLGVANGNKILIFDIDFQTILLTFEGHSDFVNALAWSPDGTRIASSSFDNTIQIWDAYTGDVSQTLNGTLSPMSSLAWSPDGTYLATSSYGKSVYIWDVDSGQLHNTIQETNDFLRWPTWSPDGNKIAYAVDQNTIAVFDVQLGETVTTTDFDNPIDSLQSIVWSTESPVIIVDHYPNIQFTDGNTGELLHTLTGHQSYTGGVALSPLKDLFAAGGINHDEIWIWNLRNGQLLHTLYEHSSSIRTIIWSPDGTHIASSSDDGTIRIWAIPNVE